MLIEPANKIAVIYFINRNLPEYWLLLGMSLISLQKTNPDVIPYLQLADDVPLHNGLRGYVTLWPFKNSDLRHPYAKQRAHLNAEFVDRGEQDKMIFADIDTLFVGSCAEPFATPLWEIGPTSRYPKLYEPNLHYNFGVTFSRRTKFWLDLIKNYNSIRAATEGEIVPNQMINSNQYEALPLDGFRYNHVVEEKEANMTDADYSKVSILHFKGRRKAFMERVFNRLFT